MPAAGNGGPAPCVSLVTGGVVGLHGRERPGLAGAHRRHALGLRPDDPKLRELARRPAGETLQHKLSIEEIEAALTLGYPEPLVADLIAGTGLSSAPSAGEVKQLHTEGASVAFLDALVRAGRRATLSSPPPQHSEIIGTWTAKGADPAGAPWRIEFQFLPDGAATQRLWLEDQLRQTLEGIYAAEQAAIRVAWSDGAADYPYRMPRRNLLILTLPEFGERDYPFARPPAGGPAGEAPPAPQPKVERGA